MDADGVIIVTIGNVAFCEIVVKVTFRTDARSGVIRNSTYVVPGLEIRPAVDSERDSSVRGFSILVQTKRLADN